MTAPTPFEELSFYHGVEDGAGGRSDWLPLQDGYVHSLTLPGNASSNLHLNDTSFGGPILTGVHDYSDRLASGSNNGFAGVGINLNEFHQLPAGQAVVSPWSDTLGMPCEHFGEPNWVYGAELLSVLPVNPPLTFTPHDSSALNQPTLTVFGGSWTLSHVVKQNADPSDPMSDGLLLPLSTSDHLPANNNDMPAIEKQSVDLSMLDFQNDFQNRPRSSVFALEHLPPSIPPFSSELEDPSYQEQGCWKYPSQGDMTYNLSPALTSNVTHVPSYETSHKSLVSTRDFNHQSVMSKSLGSLAKAMKTNKNHRIPANMTSFSRRAKKRTKYTNALHSKTKTGCRRGPLSLEERKDAALIRQKGACANCIMSKVKCSPQEICVRCRGQAASPFRGSNCHRGHLGQYSESLLPPFLDAHLEGDGFESSTSALEFIGAEIRVDVSTGLSHPPISLLVSEYIPPNQGFLAIADLTPESDDDMTAIATVSSLPYGLRIYNIDELQQKCLDHIEAISHRKHILGDTESLSWKLMQAICRFQEEDPSSRHNNLLQKAIMVNQIQYVLDHFITFTEESASKALESLQNPPKTPPSHSFLSARLLNRQLKGVFHSIQKDLLKEVLEEFERGLKEKNKDNWALYLCTFMVYCMYAEDTQVSVDGFILKKISDDGGDPSKPCYIRQCGQNFCSTLEETVVAHFWEFVNGKLNGVLRKPNIFKHGFQLGNELGHTESVVNLVDEIRQIMTDYSDEIREAAGDKYYGGSSETVREHMEFRGYNPGRLLSIVFMELLKGRDA